MGDRELEEIEVIGARPAPKGNFAFTGAQIRASKDPVRDKRPTGGPPMFINTQAPGVLTSDLEWKRTFSASADSFLSLMPGQKLRETADAVLLDGIYKDGSSNLEDLNIWKIILNGVQQVSYIASKDTINEGSEATESHGELEELRGVGIRIPSMAAGWGRTIDGLPTDPNPADTRKNDDEHKLARETWKHGAIDYRWDYRKGVWSAFNDLVEDHNDAGLSTWIFGTNNDSAQGYPFLRGALDDIFWVRKTVALQDTDGTEEGVKTGQAMIHLGAYLYDDEEKGAAQLNSVFIVPHSDGTDDECHPKGEEFTLGSELTGEGERVDIRTTAHFWKEAGIDGPINFYKRASEVEICCKPSNEKFFTGKMIYMDIDQETCPNSAGTTANPPESIKEDGTITTETGDGQGTRVQITQSAAGPGGFGVPLDNLGNPVNTTGSTTTTTGGPGQALNPTSDRCKWVPAIQIDECELVGNHFVKLITNDANIASAANTYCNLITDWTSSVASSTNANFGTAASKMVCLDDLISEAVDKFNTQISFVVANLNFQISMLQSRINAAFVAIAQCLAECDCPCIPPNVGGFDPFNWPPVQIGTCQPFLFGSVPELSCDICTAIELQGPCTNNESFSVGSPCGGGTPPAISTEQGSCQTHDSA